MTARGKPAVFLDRDGTLIEDRGFLESTEQVVFFEETIPALQRLRGDFALFIVTNQSGVGKGLITHEHVRDVNAHVVARLAGAGIAIQDVYVCPHTREDACECMKPKPHFLQVAAREHGIDLSRSFVVGDHPGDVELAANAGAHGIYVLSGHGERHKADVTVPADIVAGIEDAVELIRATHAAGVLRSGGLVAFPTETVYGLGADAANEDAVRKIFEAKGRPATHPLIVHLPSADVLDDWAAEVPPAARTLAARFWPGPLTMILARGERVPQTVTGGQDTVGLRVPAHPLTLAMLRALGSGIAGPSANRFGKVSPTLAEHVREDLGENVDYVLDGGPSSVGIESTIVDLSTGTPAILRPGAISQEALESTLQVKLTTRASSKVRAPGQMQSHYAPNATVLVVEDLAEEAKRQLEAGRKVAVLATGEVEFEDKQLVLFARFENADALAHDLYAKLREADRKGADIILISKPEEEGIGAALRDRLTKASAPKS